MNKIPTSSGITLDSRMTERIISLSRVVNTLLWQQVQTREKKETFEPVTADVWAEMDLLHGKLRADATFSLTDERGAWALTERNSLHSEEQKLIWESAMLQGQPLGNEPTTIAGNFVTVRISYDASGRGKVRTPAKGVRFPALPLAKHRSFENWQSNSYRRQAWMDKLVDRGNVRQGLINSAFATLEELILKAQPYKKEVSAPIVCVYSDFEWKNELKSLIATQKVAVTTEPIATSHALAPATKDSGGSSDEADYRLKLQTFRMTVEEMIYKVPRVWTKANKARCTFELSELVDGSQLEVEDGGSLRGLMHVRVESTLQLRGAQKPLIYIVGSDDDNRIYQWTTSSHSVRTNPAQLARVLNLADHEIVAVLLDEEQMAQLNESLPTGTPITQVNGRIGFSNGIDDIVMHASDGQPDYNRFNKLRDQGLSHEEAQAMAEQEKDSLKFGLFYALVQHGNPYTETLQEAEKRRR